jgi:hypothetical protein
MLLGVRPPLDRWHVVLCGLREGWQEPCVQGGPHRGGGSACPGTLQGEVHHPKDRLAEAGGLR